MLSLKLGKQGKPFSDGEFLKDCMAKASSILWPDNKGQLEDAQIDCNKWPDRWPFPYFG